MKWSVWNQGLGAFDYYECPKVADKLNVEKPSHLANRTLGSTIDQAAWPLPTNAKHIGSGSHAIGRVASRHRSGALGSDLGDASLIKAGLLAVSGFLLWKYVVHAPRRRST